MKKLKKVRERKYLRKRGEEKCHEREREKGKKGDKFWNNNLVEVSSSYFVCLIEQQLSSSHSILFLGTKKKKKI